MNDANQQSAHLELIVKDSRSEYIKPNLEVLESFSNIIGVTVSIGP
jgi:hypothetical protein